MKREWKAGDAIAYSSGVMLVDDVINGWAHYNHYRANETGIWYGASKFGNSVPPHGWDWWPHPDPDVVWADFAAWKLTQ